MGRTTEYEARNEPKIVSEESENDGKTYLERVTHIEKHLDNLCTVFSGYTVKSAQLRDKNDEIATTLHKFAHEEPFETTTKLTMMFLSQILVTVGDYRDTEVERLEGKVLSSLSSYGDIFKYLKTDIRKAMCSSRKESERQKDLERFLKKGDEKYREAILLAEGALERAKTESAHLNEQTQEQMMKFEHKRLVDVKESLEQFLRTEIAVHAKLVELYTEAFQTVHSIDIEADMEIIGAGLNLPYSPSKPKRRHSTKTDLRKTGSSMMTTGSFHEGKSGTVPHSRMYAPIKVHSEAEKMMEPIRKRAKELRVQNKIAELSEDSKPNHNDRFRHHHNSDESDATESEDNTQSVSCNKQNNEKTTRGVNKNVGIKNTIEDTRSSYPRSHPDIVHQAKVKNVREKLVSAEAGNLHKSSILLNTTEVKQDNEQGSKFSNRMDHKAYDALRAEDEERYGKQLLGNLQKGAVNTKGIYFEKDERSNKLKVVQKKRVSFGESESEAEATRKGHSNDKVHRTNYPTTRNHTKN